MTQASASTRANPIRNANAATPGAWKLAAIVFACLVITLICFAPRLWIMRQESPGTLQWDRSRTYLQQCESPFRRDIEPAMLCRVLPPLVAHSIGLRGRAALAIPYAGVIALTAYVAVLLRRERRETRFVFAGTLLFTTTSAILVPLHWFGMNDAWAWLAQMVVAFGTAPWAIPLACLLGPWVDERFLIGLPLAFCVRLTARDQAWSWRRAIGVAVWIIPYAVGRFALTADPAVRQVTGGFLAGNLHLLAAMAALIPMAWWMAFRAAWLPLVYGIGQRPWPLGTVSLSTATVLLFLATDMSRSVAILSPLAVLGVVAYARRHPESVTKWLTITAVANLVIPAAHVVYTRIDVISPLPVEVVRLLRWL